MTYGLSSRAELIAKYYAEYLGRFPDVTGFKMLLESTLDETGLAKAIANCEACLKLEQALLRTKEKLSAYPKNKKKLLLLGAYGNGNLGDVEMAQVIAQELEKEHDVICFSHSPLNVTDYPFDPERKLDASFEPLNPRTLLLFDGLVIGGGGFLAWPHDPIWHPSWAYLVPIPYVILAVGAGRPLDKRIYNLVSCSLIASGRDVESVHGLASAQQTAEFCPDPILSLIEPDLLPIKSDTSVVRLFVLRGERTLWHDKIKKTLRATDQVVFFEPLVDAPLLDLFPHAITAKTIDDFVKMVATADLVISERYHGAILALLCSRPTVGVYRGDHNSSKIVSLFSNLGIENYCSSDPTFLDDVENFPLEEVAIRLKSLKGIFKKSCSSIIQRLLDVSVTPLKN